MHACFSSTGSIEKTGLGVEELLYKEFSLQFGFYSCLFFSFPMGGGKRNDSLLNCSQDLGFPRGRCCQSFHQKFLKTWDHLGKCTPPKIQIISCVI